MQCRTAHFHLVPHCGPAWPSSSTACVPVCALHIIARIDKAVCVSLAHRTPPTVLAKQTMEGRVSQRPVALPPFSPGSGSREWLLRWQQIPPVTEGGSEHCLYLSGHTSCTRTQRHAPTNIPRYITILPLQSRLFHARPVPEGPLIQKSTQSP